MTSPITKSPQDTATLAACPFCGSTTAEIYEAHDVGGFISHCLTGCGAQTWGDTKAEAITAWNTRNPPPGVEREAKACAADVRAPDWPDDVVLPNGGLLFMEGNITSDTHPFSVGALRPDKTLLWEKRYVNFRTARQHFDRCVAGLPRTPDPIAESSQTEGEGK